MKYQEFISELKKLGFTIPIKVEDSYGIYIPKTPISLIPADPVKSRWNDRFCSEEKEKFVPTLILCWESGGSRGEGDWLAGTGRSVEYISDNPEPIWTDLDQILEHFCPSISYLKYRKLERQMKFFTRTDDGYYGDSTRYSFRSVSLKDLWKFLNDNKLIESNDDENDPSSLGTIQVKPRGERKPAKTKKK